jgi:two-component system phosphate regulon response regulator PhoB/two-component system alkaline phosphatase synthesis response regulator PhoP
MLTTQVIDQAGESEHDGREHPIVLLADDNEDTRDVYGVILRHYGYQVEEAENGNDAVAMTRQLHPNLVLMDIGMPGLDGWQASRVLKSDPETKAIPLVAFSARIDSTADLGGRRTFDGYILKPVSPTELVRRVRSYCELLDITPRRTNS